MDTTFIEKIRKPSQNSLVLLILKVYLLSIATFFVFRLMLLLTEINRLTFSGETAYNVIQAFIMGVRFDIVVSGYIMLFPSIIFLLEYIFNYRIRIVTKILFYWIFVLFTISFFIAAADIPFFNHFFARFNIGAFEWMDSPSFVFQMIIEEPKYIIAILPFIVLDIVFYKLLRKIFGSVQTLSEDKQPPAKPVSRVMISLVMMLMIFLGIRGRVEIKSPIRIGTAYFCQIPLLNKLGLNPVFTLLRSVLDSFDERNKSVRLIDNEIALANVREYLNINQSVANSPLSRKILYNSQLNNKPNIVLIIMECMSAAKMGRHGNKYHLTPFLDSLSEQSIYFENVYTAGEHTFIGIFSTLYSFPALYRKHTMKHIQKFDGLATSLKKLGYTTTYFTTHDGQFDNVEGFLRANDFDNVVTQSDYPAKEVHTILGVPDDYMFRYSISYINELHKSRKPFLVTFMTASDHGPYYVPEYFKPHNKDDVKKQVVEYADWSLKQFITSASKTEWFDNTIFVFIADHGGAIDVHYPISLNYHHSPLIYYSPKLIKPALHSNIGSQLDVYPTIMGLIGQSYINSTLGIDLINESRPYAIMNGDDKLAAIDNEFLFILMKNNEKLLYKYRNFDLNNCINDYPEKAKDMESYLKSNMQVYQYIIDLKKRTSADSEN